MNRADRVLAGENLTSTSAPRRFYQGDVVRKNAIDDDHKSGIVSRCYHDESDQDTSSFAKTGLDRQLKETEVGVLWYPSGDRQIVPVDELELRDRPFMLGSICKRKLTDAQSGVVTATSSTLKLQHIFSKDEIDHPVPSEDVVKSIAINHGDHVIVDDWVGEVDEVMEEALIAMRGSDRLIRICDMGGRLLIGKLPKHLHDHGDVGHSLAQLGLNEASIVDIRPTVVYVNWLALNQKLSPEEQANRPKPPALWTDLSKLTQVKAFSEKGHEIGDRVVFRTPQLKEKHGGKSTFHGKNNFAVDSMLILETRTTLTVTWQDGTQTQELAKDMVLHLNLDEHEAWPGDWVWWRPDQGEKQPRVIQTVDPIERFAVVRTPLKEPADLETVPALEIDVHGPDHLAFSLHRGDTVMICDRSIVGASPFLTTIGDPRPDYSDYQMRNDVLNAEMRELPNSNGEGSEDKPHKHMRAGAAASEVDWYGLVEDLQLDGYCRIRLPDGRTVTETLDKLFILSDSKFAVHEEGIDGGMPEDWHDDGEYYDDEYYDDYDMDEYDESQEDALWTDQNGEIIEIGNGRDDWEDMSDGEGDFQDADSSGSGQEGESRMHMDHSDTQDSGDAGEEAQVEMQISHATTSAIASKDEAAPQTDASQTAHAASAEAVPNTDTSTPAPMAALDGSAEPSAAASIPTADVAWSQFAVLESAPSSHQFYSASPSSAPGPAFFKRLQKEFKVLQSSLPETILVRAYEDRSDLLRVLIFGSEGTPYENAPFLLDFQLTPEFPSKPPIAYFHSWTNGHGRVSPNLYEDGKVCLSVLGTWSGQAEENWNPSKSSLLQVFVSIQALVLVREPYFTEPAYEKLKGSDESRVNSKNYNEKAYILSRGFVRRALEQPPEGFETELKLFYLKAGNLAKVVGRAEVLLNHPGTSTPDQQGAAATPANGVSDEALEGLTKGGAIMLSRSLKALQSILNQ
ncbi:hypothetical protein BCV70DRAFT_228640 [Testicularia cyperi]|uniref:UBC core domain-containing protein n=1 Tax=Testicularia cyperi TaxID=1882483 RepID=A0A317XG65_9BASI|nr:hypothetical protein BCV70DRAFT_228640 [Testicularia cyperi]